LYLYFSAGPLAPGISLRGWAAGLFLLLITACSTLPPAWSDLVGVSPEASLGQDGGRDSVQVLRSRADLKPAAVPNIPALRPHWQPLGGEWAAFAGRIKKPRLEFWALRIALDRGLRILIGGGKGDGKPWFGHVPSVRVSSFVRDNDLLAGINAVPFEPSSAREGEDRLVVGLGISRGRLIAPPVPRFDALVFYRDRRAAIVGQGELDAGDSEILHAVGGFHRILKNGELTERGRRKSPRYARSAAGLSAEGDTLYLVAINGERLLNRGATEGETALILRQLGAADALNLDGGGSSAMVLRFPAGISVLNTPAHGGLPGWERAVALCLGIGRD
jgi:hypothetical protein